VVDDPEDFTASTVAWEAAFAVGADRAKAQGAAGNIDFTRDALAGPAILFARAHAGEVVHFADEFVPWRAAKVVVAAENFDVGVADASEADADERPPAPQFRNRLAGSEKLAVADDEGDQGILLFGLIRQSTARRSRHTFE
jgi:hypothetical protein